MSATLKVLSMKTIVCYGDSNTWGHPPIQDLKQVIVRYGIHERWPGVMRDKLGDGFWVIEQGLSARTTVFDDPVEGLHKNGRTYLLPCLESAQPVDLVTIMLGTNDMKTRFAAPAFDIALGISQLAASVLSGNFGPNGTRPKVLIICPPPLAKLTTFAELFIGGHEKAALLAGYYKGHADTLGCGFLNAGEYVTTSDIDGVHFDVSEHKKLGIAVAEKVKQMLA